MRRILARAAAVFGAVALVGTLAAPAQADSTDDVGAWLSDQLVDGLVPSTWGGSDYGVSIDVLDALVTLGVEPGAVDAILDALEADPLAYASGGDPEETWAGSTGKLATAVILGGRDPRNFGGVDLIQRIEDVTVTEGPETGWAKDVSAWGDYSNLFGQSWVTRALVLADSDLADEAVAFLISQQCADGGFAGTLSADGCAAGSTTTIDATAFALFGFSEFAGDDTLVEPAWNAAIHSISSQQLADGSFASDEGPNANTTGLAALWLHLAGFDQEARDAAEWVRDLQVVASDGQALSGEVGAIAYNDAAFAAGLAEGLANADVRHQWIRSTAQASLAYVALDELEPIEYQLTVEPTGPVAPGTTLSVNISGLVPGEEFYVYIDGDELASGTGAVNGTATVTITAPDEPGTYSLIVLNDSGLASAELVVEAGASPTPTASTPTTDHPGAPTTPTAGPTVQPTEGSTAGGSGILPGTGADLGVVAFVIAGVLIVGGASALFLARRRQKA